MGVEYALGMLLGGAVVAQQQVQAVPVGAQPAQNGCDAVVAVSPGVPGDNLQPVVLIAVPPFHHEGDKLQEVAAGAGELKGSEGPCKVVHLDAGKTRQRVTVPDRRLFKGEDMVAGLVVVVAQY